MKKVIIKNLNISVEIGADDQTVLHAALSSGLDWMHSCGAKGKCTTCRMQVLEGKEHLLPYTEPELAYLSEGKLKLNERLACQTRISGDIVVRIPRSSQLPHLTYAG